MLTVFKKQSINICPIPSQFRSGLKTGSPEQKIKSKFERRFENDFKSMKPLFDI